MCLGIPGRVTEIYEAGGIRMGKVDFAGITKEVCLAYVPEIQLGDYTIVHVGFAITQLDEESARESLELFTEMGRLNEELNPEEAELAASFPPPRCGARPVKYLDEFRDPELAASMFAEIRAITTRPWAIMEVCGGQTHSIIRNGIDQLLPPEIELIHGPGCPVCVTPLEMIDKALVIAGVPNVIFCSFGDMLRVPGSEKDLFRIKSEGGDVRIVYSPLDAVKIAQVNPTREVVFFAIGFETTAPANAMAAHLAAQLELKNFSLLVSHVLVPPAISAIMESPVCRVQAFLAAGHVCSVMGTEEYRPLVEKYHVPIVVTGFEPLDVLEGIRRTVLQLEGGRAELDNAYARAVRPEGNLPARQMLGDVFEVTDRGWRGIGVIPQSGWRLAEHYRTFDAELRFDVGEIRTQESALCKSGEVLQGLLKPNQCPAFGKECTPRTPLGATMVSTEGACAAYYQYGRFTAASDHSIPLYS
ncbi:MAG: hydrogenase formation protein HypD [Anaerolineales bacterium]|nr:hydrogenase formation protein HypD [Anaerolineales bacterium]